MRNLVATQRPVFIENNWAFLVNSASAWIKQSLACTNIEPNSAKTEQPVMKPEQGSTKSAQHAVIPAKAGIQDKANPTTTDPDFCGDHESVIFNSIKPICG